MEIQIFNQTFPIERSRIIQDKIKQGLCEEYINIPEQLGKLGLQTYQGADTIDVFTLNEIILEYQDLSQEEFQRICSILEVLYQGDLECIHSALKDLQTNKLDFISTKQQLTQKLTDDYLTQLGYSKAQFGFLRSGL